MAAIPTLRAARDQLFAVVEVDIELLDEARQVADEAIAQELNEVGRDS